MQRELRRLWIVGPAWLGYERAARRSFFLAPELGEHGAGPGYDERRYIVPIRSGS
jgi:hypothetical protein